MKHVSDSEDLFFADDEESAPDPGPQVLPWHLLVVDDEPEVHEVTFLNLERMTFEGRKLRLASAYSAREARAYLRQHQDVALILLDVVMEEDDAGLQLVRYIRNELDNHHTRIILRTGQPGMAPEREVIVTYDINDYKAKSELTSQRLFTTVLTALRSYRDLAMIETQSQGLHRLVASSSLLFQLQTPERMAATALTQMEEILQQRGGGLFGVISSGNSPADSGWRILATSGRFAGIRHADLLPLSEETWQSLAQVVQTREVICRQNRMMGFVGTQRGGEGVIYLEGERTLNEFDRRVMALFCHNIGVSFENVFHYDQFRHAQEAAILSLAKLAEYKDTDTGDHLSRVEKLTKGIALEMPELDDQLREIIAIGGWEQVGLASILHDVGKVGIPETILLKKGPLTQEERTFMERHTVIGGNILAQAANHIGGNNYLALGAVIARSHHERFDGTGYPDGLAGQAIPLAARIVAVADVFDALVTRRPYKEPWNRADAVAHIRQAGGSHFDPQVVAAFLRYVEKSGDRPTE